MLAVLVASLQCVRVKEGDTVWEDGNNRKFKVSIMSSATDWQKNKIEGVAGWQLAPAP